MFGLYLNCILNGKVCMCFLSDRGELVYFPTGFYFCYQNFAVSHVLIHSFMNVKLGIFHS